MNPEDDLKSGDVRPVVRTRCAVGADEILSRPFKPEEVRHKGDALLDSPVPWTDRHAGVDA